MLIHEKLVNMLQGMAFALLFFSLAVADNSPERTAAKRAHQEQTLIDKLLRIEADDGPLAGAAIPKLLDLSLLYIQDDHCADAIAALMRAVKLSRMNYGLFNPQQLELNEPLLECYLGLDLKDAFERQQRYTVLIGDTVYGKNHPSMLPLLRCAGWRGPIGRRTRMASYLPTSPTTRAAVPTATPSIAGSARNSTSSGKSP